MKKNRKTALIAGLIVVVIIAGFFIVQNVRANQAAAATEGIETVTVQKDNLISIVGTTGNIRPEQTAVLSFQTSGSVAGVLISTGDQVVIDQELAFLDPASLSSQVILAEADLLNAQTNLDNLLASGATLAQKQSELANALDALEDMEYHWRVQQEGYRASDETIAKSEANLVLAEAQVERDETKYNSLSGRPTDDPARAQARSNLANSREHYNATLRNLNWYTGHPTETQQSVLDADLAAAQARYEDATREFERWQNGPPADEISAAEARVIAAQATLDMQRIQAPFAGTITDVSITLGDWVQPGVIALRLSDLDPLLIDVEVSEVDINMIAVGQPVTITLDAALGKEYQGQVVEVSIEGIEIQGVVNFDVVVELSNPDEDIRSGLTAAVNIEVSNLEDVLVVPNRSVRIYEGQHEVYVLNADNTIEARAIELGASDIMYSEVCSGNLVEGEQIILNPSAEIVSQAHGVAAEMMMGPGSGDGGPLR